MLFKEPGSLQLTRPDVAILLIAIHATMYVLGRRSSSLGGGLYAHRRIAYAVWLVMPLLAASLAFIKGHGYVFTGFACETPVRPYWYRMSLSWIPRYAIFLIILVLYLAMYIYVNDALHGFRREGSTAGHSTTLTARQISCPQSPGLAQLTSPPIPRLNLHGLVPDSKPASIVETREVKSLAARIAALPSPKPPTWRLPVWHHARGSLIVNESPELGASETDSFPGPSTPKARPSIVVASRDSSSLASESSTTPSVSRETSWRDVFVRRLGTSRTSSSLVRIQLNMTSFLRVNSTFEPNEAVSPLRLVNTRGEDLQELDLLATRNRIRRQLHFIFLYPLVYMIMWTPPLIYSLCLYSDRFARHPPFAFRCLVTTISCLHAAVDCLLFCYRETPWRHIPGNNEGFAGSLRFWRDWSEIRKRYTMRAGPGKTREEMHREAAIAIVRRQDEIMERRDTIASRVSDKTSLGASPGKLRRSPGVGWWDLKLGLVEEGAPCDYDAHWTMLAARRSRTDSSRSLEQ